MDNDTKKLLMVVICFSIASNLYRDIGVLASGIPFLFKILFSPITGPLFVYFAQLVLFLMSLVSAIIIPGYMIKYFMMKGRITIGYDIMHHMFKPQLYCAVLGIARWILGIIFSALVPIFG